MGIADVDDDGSGEIGYPEFLKMMTHKILNKDPKDDMLKAFRLFDDDQTGSVSLKNLKRVCKESNQMLDEAELQEMLDDADKDGDGVLNEEISCPDEEVEPLVSLAPWRRISR